jgi:hypothetical protein
MIYQVVMLMVTMYALVICAMVCTLIVTNNPK